MATSLTNRQRKHLRGLSHALNPVVMVGQRGLTAAVLDEIDAALGDHELIKVKLRGDREARTAWIDTIGATTGAVLVQTIGQTACFYRRHPDEPKIQLPSASGRPGQAMPRG